MHFVPRRVARKGQQKSTSRHIASIPAATSSSSSTFDSSSTSASHSIEPQSRQDPDTRLDGSAHNQDSTPRQSGSEVAASTSSLQISSQDHLTANALAYLLSPVYLIHPQNEQLRDTFMSLGQHNGSRGIQEEGETFLHLSRLLSDPIIATLCPNIHALLSALKELEPLGYLKLSPSGYGVRLTNSAKLWINEMFTESSNENEGSLTRLESKTIYIEDLSPTLSTSLSIAQHLKPFTSLSILSVIPSISPLEKLENFGRGLSAFESLSDSSNEPSRAGSFPSFISSSNLTALKPNSGNQTRFSSSAREGQVSDLPSEIDWSTVSINARNSSSTSKSALKRHKLLEEVFSRRPRGGRALVTFGLPSTTSTLDGESSFSGERFERESNNLLERAPWQDDKGKSTLPFRCLSYSDYRSLANEYVEYKQTLHDRGWRMNYPPSSDNIINIYSLRPSKLSDSSSVPQRREKNVLESTSKEPDPTPHPNRMNENLSHLMNIPSASELEGRRYPHSTIVKVKVKILQSKEDSKQKKSNPKVLIQVEADRLIQKQSELLNSSGDSQLQKQSNSKEKEKAVDYVDWKEGDEFAHLRLSTSYHAALLSNSITNSSQTSNTDSKIAFTQVSILERSEQESYWSSLPGAVRNSSKKREIKVWDLLKKAKDLEKNGLDREATNGIDLMERKEENDDDDDDDEKQSELKNNKKKKKKGKKRKAEDEVEDEAQLSKKHIRFD